MEKNIYLYIYLGEVEDVGEEKYRSEIHLGRPHPVRDTAGNVRISCSFFFSSLGQQAPRL